MTAVGRTWRRIGRNRTIVTVAAVLAGIVIVSIVEVVQSIYKLATKRVVTFKLHG